MNVAVLGASTNPERYAYKAQQLLSEHGHTVFPVSPRYPEVQGVPAYMNLASIEEPIDTITVYMRPQRLAQQVEGIVAQQPRRVILNPGTEHTAIEAVLEQQGIHVVKACTLVLLKTQQFDSA